MEIIQWKTKGAHQLRVVITQNCFSDRTRLRRRAVFLWCTSCWIWSLYLVLCGREMKWSGSDREEQPSFSRLVPWQMCDWNACLLFGRATGISRKTGQWQKSPGYVTRTADSQEGMRELMRDGGRAAAVGGGLAHPRRRWEWLSWAWFTGS